MEEILRLIYGDKHCRAHHNRNRREIVDGAQLCAIVASTGGEEARLGKKKGDKKKIVLWKKKCVSLSVHSLHRRQRAGDISAQSLFRGNLSAVACTSAILLFCVYRFSAKKTTVL